MTSKKAAMELSINAIVILIIAITMLGLGIGFVKGMFGKISTQVEEKVAEEPEPAAPNAKDPVSLSREVIVTRANQDESIKVGAYNPSSVEWTDEAPSITCNVISPSFEVNKRTLKPTEQATYTILTKIPNAAAQSYLCKVTMPGLGTLTGFESYYKELTIKIVQ